MPFRITKFKYWPRIGIARRNVSGIARASGIRLRKILRTIPATRRIPISVVGLFIWNSGMRSEKRVLAMVMVSSRLPIEKTAPLMEYQIDG
jgi:hypothetical protein